MLTVAMEAKRLQLLHELIPNAAVVAIIVNPNKARTLGVQVEAFKAGSPSEIDAAFTKLVEHRVSALHIAADAFSVSHKSSRGWTAEIQFD